MSFDFPWPTVSMHCERLVLDEETAEEVADRQDRVAGFSTAALGRARVLLVGCGGLGGAIATGLTRKGVGRLDLVDHDFVELSNLNRQAFYRDDLFQPKALRLAVNAARDGFLGGICVGHHVAFDERTAMRFAETADAVVCAVDNNEARAVCSRFFRKRGVPVVHTAVNENADYCWCFVDEPAGPCPGCVFPRIAAASSERQRCHPVPAVLDVLRIAGGLVLYALDSVLMDRPRGWNFRSVHLIGGMPDVVDTAVPRGDCPLCQ